MNNNNLKNNTWEKFLFEHSWEWKDQEVSIFFATHLEHNPAPERKIFLRETKSIHLLNVYEVLNIFDFA